MRLREALGFVHNHAGPSREVIRIPGLWDSKACALNHCLLNNGMLTKVVVGS